MKIDCILPWSTQAFITLRSLPFGHLLRIYNLEMFLNNTEILKRADFDAMTVTKAFDACFPGSLNNYHKVM